MIIFIISRVEVFQMTLEARAIWKIKEKVRRTDFQIKFKSTKT